MTTATAMTNREGAHNTMVWCAKDSDNALSQFNNDSALNGWIGADLLNLVAEGKKHVYTLKGFSSKRMVIWEGIQQCNELFIRRSEVVMNK